MYTWKLYQNLSPGFSMPPRLPRRLEPFTSWLAVAAAAATAASTASALGVGSWRHWQQGVVMAQWMPRCSKENELICGMLLLSCRVWVVGRWYLDAIQTGWWPAFVIGAKERFGITWGRGPSHPTDTTPGTWAVPSSITSLSATTSLERFLAKPALRAARSCCRHQTWRAWVRKENSPQNKGVSGSNVILVPCWGMQLYHYDDQGPALLTSMFTWSPHLR